MSCKVISGNDSVFHLCSSSYDHHHHQSRKSVLERSSHLSFNAHLKNPSLSLKVPSVSSSRTTVRASVNAIYAPAHATETLYELLGISESGTPSEIKRAYKQLARKYHPDVSPPDRVEENTKRFIRVQEAYETLSDPSSRALYDGDLAKGLPLGFSSRRRSDERSVEKDEWRVRWESQLMELKKRSMNKESRERMSWGSERSGRSRNSIFDLGF